MSYGAYPTPSVAAIYIGEHHVDDAYSVEWEFRDSSSPMFTYFAKQWINVARGKDIVIGSLSVNFRYPGYLATAIRESRSKHAVIGGPATNQNEYVGRYLDEMRDGDANSRLKLLLQAAEQGPEALRKMSVLASAGQGAFQQSLVSRGRMRNDYRDVFEEQTGWQNQITPVDIWTHYGDTNTTHTVDIIKDVVFTGKSKQVQAGATASGGLSASGINLLEVYSFFAKGIQQIVVDPSNI